MIRWSLLLLLLWLLSKNGALLYKDGCGEDCRLFEVRAGEPVAEAATMAKSIMSENEEEDGPAEWGIPPPPIPVAGDKGDMREVYME